MKMGDGWLLILLPLFAFLKFEISNNPKKLTIVGLGFETEKRKRFEMEMLYIDMFELTAVF